MVRMSVAAPKSTASSQLVARIKSLGLEPIVTPTIIRAVYEGHDHRLADKLVNLFEHEKDHDIYIDTYTSEKQ